MDSEDALVLVFSRNAFYRRLHFLVFSAFILSLIVIAILGTTLSYLLKNSTKPVYFAADDVGRLIQIIPVNTPNMSIEGVMNWTVKAVESAFSYDYVNYHGQLQAVQNYFTSYGWSTYINALSLSGNLRALTTRNQIVIAKVIEKPKIVNEGLLAGAYAWKFQFPILVTYSMPPYDGSNEFTNSLIVSVIVQRQQILEGENGLGIVQLVSNLAGSEEVNPSLLEIPAG
jgi:intracellular multiplication protein IcmL